MHGMQVLQINSGDTLTYNTYYRSKIHVQIKIYYSSISFLWGCHCCICCKSTVAAYLVPCRVSKAQMSSRHYDPHKKKSYHRKNYSLNLQRKQISYMPADGLCFEKLRVWRSPRRGYRFLCSIFASHSTLVGRLQKGVR